MLPGLRKTGILKSVWFHPKLRMTVHRRTCRGPAEVSLLSLIFSPPERLLLAGNVRVLMQTHCTLPSLTTSQDLGQVILTQPVSIPDLFASRLWHVWNPPNAEACYRSPNHVSRKRIGNSRLGHRPRCHIR